MIGRNPADLQRTSPIDATAPKQHRAGYTVDKNKARLVPWEVAAGRRPTQVERAVTAWIGDADVARGDRRGGTCLAGVHGWQLQQPREQNRKRRPRGGAHRRSEGRDTVHASG